MCRIVIFQASQRLFRCFQYVKTTSLTRHLCGHTAAMEQTVSSALIAFAIIASVIAAGFFAYNQGYLDPLIEKIG